ncbi:MAG TPA: hypothetical protein VF136_10395 [Methylomirabilota bacterium]
MAERRLPFLVALTLVLTTGCAAKMTPQQAVVDEAFRACRVQGPSAKLERVERDGRFSIVGREGDAQRVHECMVRYAAPPPPKQAPKQVTRQAPAASPRAQALVPSRLPGTWQGTLKLPARAQGEAEMATPATVRFVVAGGSLRWSMATRAATRPLAADGTAVVVNGELRMTGTMRATRPNGGPKRSTVTVRYEGAMVGNRLEVRGVTTDRQVHLLSVRRVPE